MHIDCSRSSCLLQLSVDHTGAAGGKCEGLDNKFPALHIISNKLVLRELLLTPGLHPDERSGTARLPVVAVAGGHPHRLDEPAELSADGTVDQVPLLVLGVRPHPWHDQVLRAGARVIVVPDTSLYDVVLFQDLLLFVEHIKHCGLSLKGSADSINRIS